MTHRKLTKPEVTQTHVKIQEKGKMQTSLFHLKKKRTSNVNPIPVTTDPRYPADDGI